MLDFGFAELVFIIIALVLVIGPQDIPKIMVGLGRLTRRIGYIRYAFSTQFDEFMREADLNDIRQQVNFEAAPDDMDFDEAEADTDIAEPAPQKPKKKVAAKARKKPAAKKTTTPKKKSDVKKRTAKKP